MKINMPYKIVPLSEVVYFQEGPGLRNWQYANEGIPFLNIRTLTDEGFINKSLCQCVKKEEFTNKYEHFLLNEGDFVVSSSGTLGKLAEVRKQDLPIMLNTSVIRFRPLDTNILDRDFLKWFIKSPLYFRQIESASTGTAIKNYGPSHLKKMVIPLPPIASQRRIADILDKADEIIRKRKEAIALTEQLQKSIFLDMFGDPVTNPKGWEKVTVNDVVSEVKDGPHVSPEYSHNGIPILSTRNIRPNELIMEDIKYISEDVYLNLIKRFKPQKGDVLLTKGGTTGFAKVVDWDWNFAVWVHLALLRPNNKIRSEFLEATLNSPNCYLQSQLYTHGIANKDLGLNRIRKIKMCLPPLDLQDEYCQIRKKTLFLLNKNKKSLKESENLFNSLLQKAFKGEL